jgi:hypothetical protein
MNIQTAADQERAWKHRRREERRQRKLQEQGWTLDEVVDIAFSVYARAPLRSVGNVVYVKRWVQTARRRGHTRTEVREAARSVTARKVLMAVLGLEAT